MIQVKLLTPTKAAALALLASASVMIVGSGVAIPGRAQARSGGGSVDRTTPRPSEAKAGIVLVHGAFADASGWHPVTRILQQEGYRVVAVQNSLGSLAGDVESTKRVIDAQTGPVVVVGHSYGGAVISAAAAGNPNVKALVYIAAFAPEPGEAVGALIEKYASDLAQALAPDAAGFVYIDPAKYHDIFAGDIPVRETRAMAVAQKPIFGAIFDQSFSAAAWKTIPSWYLVTQQDRAINPELQRFYARRMKPRRPRSDRATYRSSRTHATSRS